MTPSLFPPSANRLPRLLFTAACALILLLAGTTYYAWTPKTLREGFSPEQPIPFSHKVHVSRLGMSCNACHSAAAWSSRAGLPDAHSCLACHKQILPDSPKLIPLKAATDKTHPRYDGLPLTWARVNRLPGYAVFNHSAHVNRGVACASCHGDVTKEERVTVKKSLSMAWCLECHRNPAPTLRPLEYIEAPDFDPAAYLAEHPLPQTQPAARPGSPAERLGDVLKEHWRIQPRTDCNACHH